MSDIASTVLGSFLLGACILLLLCSISKSSREGLAQWARSEYGSYGGDRGFHKRLDHNLETEILAGIKFKEGLESKNKDKGLNDLEIRAPMNGVNNLDLKSYLPQIRWAAEGSIPTNIFGNIETCPNGSHTPAETAFMSTTTIAPELITPKKGTDGEFAPASRGGYVLENTDYSPEYSSPNLLSYESTPSTGYAAI
jgi:hypothetical protein